jgi:RNA polymerase sigma factor (sigma-70 family)
MTLRVVHSLFGFVASSFYFILSGETFLLSVGLLLGLVKSGSEGEEGRAEDAEYVQRTRDGDKDAYVFLFNKYNDAIYRYCYFFLFRRKEPQEDAQDAMREAYMKCLENINNIRKKGSFFSYLKSTAYHLCMDKLKDRHADDDPYILTDNVDSEEASEGIGGLVEGHTPEMGAMTNEVTRDVRKAVSSLPENHRRAVVLVHFMEYRYDEAAAQMGVGVEDIRRWVHRGLTKLRTSLQGHRESIS